MEKKPIMNAPRDEIWFRKIYIDLINQHKITTIFRPGARHCNTKKGFCNGETLKIKVLDKVGADWADLSGKTLPDFEHLVQVSETRVCTLGALTKEDFNGSSPDIFDITSLTFHLGAVYNLAPNELHKETVITKTTFKYL